MPQNRGTRRSTISSSVKSQRPSIPPMLHQDLRPTLCPSASMFHQPGCSYYQCRVSFRNACAHCSIDADSCIARILLKISSSDLVLSIADLPRTLPTVTTRPLKLSAVNDSPSLLLQSKRIPAAVSQHETQSSTETASSVRINGV